MSILGIDNSITDAFRDVEAIESIYIVREGGLRHVFLIVNEDSDRQLYRMLYEREIAFSDDHPNDFLEFHIVARRNRPIQQVMGSREPHWQRDGVGKHHCLTAVSI